jgi:hypothetical protein
MSAIEVPDPIDRFVQAVNGGDREAFLAFFPKEGVVNDSGTRYAGHAAIRRWSDREFIGAKGWITVTEFNRSGDTVTLTANWASKYFSGPSRSVFVLNGKQITELRISALGS